MWFRDYVWKPLDVFKYLPCAISGLLIIAHCKSNPLAFWAARSLEKSPLLPPGEGLRTSIARIGFCTPTARRPSSKIEFCLLALWRCSRRTRQNKSEYVFCRDSNAALPSTGTLISSVPISGSGDALAVKISWESCRHSYDFMSSDYYPLSSDLIIRHFLSGL